MAVQIRYPRNATLAVRYNHICDVAIEMCRSIYYSILCDVPLSVARLLLRRFRAVRVRYLLIQYLYLRHVRNSPDISRIRTSVISFKCRLNICYEGLQNYINRLSEI